MCDVEYVVTGIPWLLLGTLAEPVLAATNNLIEIFASKQRPL